MNVLGIESTCDETACAVVRDGMEILSNVVASQTDLHNLYGGVVPELACRRHIDVVIPVIRQALDEASMAISDIDLFAVANGPGLIGPLLIGLNTAKALSFASDNPFVGVNHVEAHLYAAIMSNPDRLELPALGVVVSGGHTSLVVIKDIGAYDLIASTVDDAVGEAFDKVAKILGLPYPGGPEVENLAKNGDPARYPFKGGVVKGKPLAFSFSGLKTSVLYAVKGQNATGQQALTTSDKADIAASFQRAAVDDVVKKAIKAASELGCRSMVLGGGVTNNQLLQKTLNSQSPLPCLWPSPEMSMDNAAMIAGLGFHVYQKNGGDTLDLDAITRVGW